MEEFEDDAYEDEHLEDAESGEVASPHQDLDDSEETEDTENVDWRAARERMRQKDETIRRNEEVLKENQNLMREMALRQQEEMAEMRRMLMQGRSNDDDYRSSYSDGFDEEQDEEEAKFIRWQEKSEQRKREKEREERNKNWRKHVSEQCEDWDEVCTKENISKLKQRQPRLFNRLDASGPDADLVDVYLALYDAIKPMVSGSERESKSEGSNIDRMMQSKKTAAPASAVGRKPTKSGARSSDSSEDLMAEVMRCMR